jgi:hypothetical protein
MSSFIQTTLRFGRLTLIRAAKRGSTMAMLKIVVDEMVNGKNFVYLEKKTIE